MAIYETRAPQADRPLDHVEFGPGSGADLDRRLLGEVTGGHALVVGSGAGHDAVGLALRGARVTAIDRDVAQIASGRDLAAREHVTVAFHQGELAELAFVAADQVDIAVSVGALSYVDDLDRVFRQVHRVLKPGTHFVIAVPHPAILCADPIDPGRATRRWDDPAPVGERWVHRAEDLVTALRRANFAIDTILERHGPGPGTAPETLVVRGEKLGA